MSTDPYLLNPVMLNSHRGIVLLLLLSAWTPSVALVPTMLLLLLAPKAVHLLSLQLVYNYLSTESRGHPLTSMHRSFAQTHLTSLLILTEHCFLMRIQSRPILSSNSTIGSTAHLVLLVMNQCSQLSPYMVQPQDRPPDVLVCPQDRPPDDPVQPQDRPPDRSMDSDRQTDSDETHVKFVNDEILMLRANPSKPNNCLLYTSPSPRDS